MQNNKENPIAATLSILGIAVGAIVAIVTIITFIMPQIDAPQLDKLIAAILGILFGGILGVATWFCFRVIEEIINLQQQSLNTQQEILAKLNNQNQGK